MTHLEKRILQYKAGVRILEQRQGCVYRKGRRSLQLWIDMITNGYGESHSPTSQSRMTPGLGQLHGGHSAPAEFTASVRRLSNRGSGWICIQFLEWSGAAWWFIMALCGLSPRSPLHLMKRTQICRLIHYMPSYLPEFLGVGYFFFWQRD